MEALPPVRPRVNLQLVAAYEETRSSSYVFTMTPKVHRYPLEMGLDESAFDLIECILVVFKNGTI